MDLVTKIAKRLAEGVADAFLDMTKHAVNILATLFVCFVLSFLPTWLIGLFIAVLGAVIVYFTYKDEIAALEKGED